MELLPGRRYRFWIRGEPLPDTVKFEKAILQQQRPDLPRFDASPPLPVQDVYFQFRHESGHELTISASELKGMGLELVD